MDEFDLKPCPFCGSTASFVFFDLDDETEYRVECNRCFAATFYEDTKEEAASQWNERADHG